MDAKKLGLLALVAGAIISFSAIGNNIYHKTRINNSRKAIPKKALELDEDFGILSQDPNFYPEQYQEVLIKARDLQEEYKTNILEAIQKYNSEVKRYNQSRVYTKAIGLVGFGIMAAGYVLRKVDIQVSRNSL